MGSKQSSHRRLGSNQSKEQPCSPFPLLSLPRELREIIYKYAFSSPTGYIYTYGLSAKSAKVSRRNNFIISFSTLFPSEVRLDFEGEGQNPVAGLVLLRANSQIRDEAMPHLYSQNVFMISPLVPQVPRDALARNIRHVFLYAYKGIQRSRSWDVESLIFTRTMDAVRRMLVLETVSIRVATGHFRPIELLGSGYARHPGFFGLLLATLRHDHDEWVNLLDAQELKSGQRRIVRRTLEIERPLGEELEYCAARISQIQFAFIDEVRFFHVYLDGRGKLAEATSPVILPDQALWK